MKNTIKFLITISVVMSPLLGKSQTPGTHPAMEPIRLLFEGMKTGDSAKVHRAFVSDASLVTVAKNKSGQSRLIREPLIEFLKAVGVPHTESWNEPIWDPVIQVDGILAQVWAKYAFYLGKKFSHCGVDTFQLIQQDDGQWKIFHLADTRQREGCVVPPEVSRAFE